MTYMLTYVTHPMCVCTEQQMQQQQQQQQHQAGMQIRGGSVDMNRGRG